MKRRRSANHKGGDKTGQEKNAPGDEEEVLGKPSGGQQGEAGEERRATERGAFGELSGGREVGSRGAPRR